MLNLRSLYGPNTPAATLLAAPTGVATPTALGSGASTTTGTKYFVLTYVNPAGETVSCVQVSVSNTAGNTITVTSPSWPANMAITKAKVYEGTASGGPFYLQGAITASGGTLSVTTEPSALAANPPTTTVAAPAGVPTPTASGTGTSTTTGTKYFVLTYVTTTGETIASSQVSVSNTAANTITVTSPTWPGGQGILSANVYEGTASGGPYYYQGNIGASAGTLSVTTEPNTSNTQALLTAVAATAIQPVLIGTVGTASGSGATAWLSTWTDVRPKTIILGNADTANKATMSVFLVRSGGAPAPSNMIVPVRQCDVGGNAQKNNLWAIPFSNIDMQNGDALWALQHQTSPLVILTIDAGVS